MAGLGEVDLAPAGISNPATPVSNNTPPKPLQVYGGNDEGWTKRKEDIDWDLVRNHPSRGTYGASSYLTDFEKDTMPLLMDMQDSIKTRRDDYRKEAVLGANTGVDLAVNQQNYALDSIGISADADQQAAINRASSLGRTSASVAGENAAVDAADNVNLETAVSLSNIGAELEGQSISDKMQADGVTSSREMNATNARKQRQANVMQGVATVAMMAMMFM